MSEPAESESLRTAMRRWATGVTLVASSDGSAARGMTVSSFTALSLQPPLVLVALEQGTRTHDMVARQRSFAVTVLAEDQLEVAERFAGRRPEVEDRFANLTHTYGPTGSPYLPDGLAYLDCRVVGMHAAGTHTAFVGEVVEAAQLREASPLLYYSRTYRGLGR